MAHLVINHKSKELNKEINMNVILPNALPADGEKLPVLYLLHGMSDNGSNWVRYTSVERYAWNSNVIIVMPDASRSFYTDMKYGLKYFAYISKEVPEYIEAFLPASKKREDRYIAGNSMGGYGAMKIGLTYPERYSAIASFSGVCDIERVYKNHTISFVSTFGENPDLTDHDLYKLAEKVNKQELKPKIYQCCGDKDPLLESNQKYRDFMNTLDFDYTYCEDDAVHNWDYWDIQIEKTLKLFNLA